MLKVVHISTFSSGGAGRAAIRLHESMLNRSDIHSTFITTENNLNHCKPNQINASLKSPNFLNRLANRLGFPILNTQKNFHLLKDFDCDCEIYSLPTTDYLLENLDAINNADIINLHWIANFVNYPTFFKAYMNKPLIWTLHDMNPFMGGFHYRNDYNTNKRCHTLENSLFTIKQEAIKRAKNLNIVTPSKWLRKEAINSNMFKIGTVFNVIPYGLNLEKFKPISKRVARKKLSIDDNLPCILIIAEYLDNHRKGIDLLIDALKSINTQYFQIITIGSNKLNIKGNFTITELGSIDNDELLVTAYSAADLFILPSREDNLPNVMLESFACGTPILSFEIGGMEDWIIPGFNGLFASSIDSEGLKSALENFINAGKQLDSKQIRKFALNNFDQNIQAEKYIDLYRSVINK